MSRKLTQTLQKLKKYETNPDVFSELSSNELASLVVHVMTAFRGLENKIAKDIKDGRYDAYQPVAGEDYEAREAVLKAFSEYSNKTTAQVNKKLSQLQIELNTAVKKVIAGIKNGQDGVVTDKEIQRAAQIASKLIDLPDFEKLVDTALTSNGEAVRDALELLQGDARLSIDAISGTENWKKEMAELAKTNPNAGLGGFGPNTVRKLITESNTGGSFDETADYTLTGAWNFGNATDVELPNGVAPTVDTDGQVAIDTDITDMSHGLMKYYAGEEVVTVSMPVAQLSALNNGWIPAYNATADEFQMTAPASGSGDTYNVSVNTLTIDSTAGTSDTWGVLAGAVNGVNTTYTVSTGVYKSGTLKVFKNNLLLIQGTGEDWVETTPASGTFDFNTAPLSGDVITVEYSDQDTTANSLIVEKDTTTVSTNYTALITDRNINVNAASGDITITLPALGDIDSIGITIKKIDTSGNVVTIATPNSETIDGDSTDSVDEPQRAKTVYSDGTNYFNK